MGLGVSRSVPSSPGAGERSPSDKFNMASSSQDTSATTTNPGATSDTATVRYNNKVSSNMPTIWFSQRRVLLAFPAIFCFQLKEKSFGRQIQLITTYQL